MVELIKVTKYFHKKDKKFQLKNSICWFLNYLKNDKKIKDLITKIFIKNSLKKFKFLKSTEKKNKKI